tara:strand:+ start:2032 stop:2292 length:261 start_codon:yes stop_codon:yes gene_type:complete
MKNLQLLQELAMSADFMVLEKNNIVRLVWDEVQGVGDNKRLNARKKELKELVNVAESVVKDDGNLHVSVSMELVNVQELESWVEML